MTTRDEMLSKEAELLVYIQRKGEVFQSEIIQQFADKFGYANYSTHRVMVGKILNNLLKREHIRIQEIDDGRKIPRNKVSINRRKLAQIQKFLKESNKE